MPELYAIQGKAKVGKSTSILNLRNLLIVAGFTSRLNPPPIIDFKDVLDGISPTTGKPVVVGLSSAGDTDWQVRDGLKILIPTPCDIIFCACRTSGAGVAAIQATTGFNISYIGKGYSSSAHRVAIDAAFAKFLFALV
jgi:hypothetical protein